ncbi:lasso RiPP family leader peptide-containing protein [Actinoallomurus sp. NPDC050550]|jgi:hypothetical protein
MDRIPDEPLPYEPPMLAEAGSFAEQTKGAGGLIPEFHGHIPH